MRKSLYSKNNFYYGSFCKTNGWIYKDFNLNSFKFDISNLIIKFYTKSNQIRIFLDLIDSFYKFRKYRKTLNYSLKVLELKDTPIDVKEALLIKIFNCYIWLKDIKNAKEYFEKYREFAKRFNSTYYYSTINLAFGKIAFLEENYKEAIKYFKKVNYSFYLGKYYLKSDLKLAKNYFQKSIKYFEDLGRVGDVAGAYPYLAKIYLKEKNNIKAFEYITLAKNTFNHYGINFEEFREIEEEVLNRLSPKEAIELSEKYRDKILESEKMDFLTPKFDSEIVAKDNKKMILIKEGMSFFGEGEEKSYDIYEILDNMEEVLKDDFFDEKAKHLYLYNYYIDREVVTVDEYLKFCRETKYEYSKELENQNQNEPITNITSIDAEAYAKWTGKELAIPEELEKAIRNGHINSNLKEMAITDKALVVMDRELNQDEYQKDYKSPTLGFRCVKPMFSSEDFNS